MLDMYIHCPQALAEAQHIPDTNLRDFLHYLESKGYSPGTIHSYVGAVIHFNFWQRRQSKASACATHDDALEFLSKHLPYCSCPPSFPRHKVTIRAALKHWVGVVGAGDSFPQESSEQEQLVWAFDRYLADVAGLSPSTRLYRRRYAIEFLKWVKNASPFIQLSTLTNVNIGDYICQRSSGISLPTIAVIACSLSSFLRFLSAKGYCSLSPDFCVPHPTAVNTIPTVPALTFEELTCLLKAIDRTYPVGKRDYAMARCLSDLGLRTSDVAQLRLNDVDWRHGVITLRPGKSRRSRRLPLPDTLRDALIDYLQNARPVTTERAIFVYHRAPQGEAVAPSTVRGAIRRAFTRAGFSFTENQVHRLRHTMATRLLQSGNSLKVIADVLGHQCLDTTTRYTFIDRPALLAVALPWPQRIKP